MANTKSNSQAQPGAAQLGAKTLSRRQARLDRFVAWFFSFLLLVVVVGLWGVSRFVVDKENAGGDTTVGYVLGGITAVTYLVVSLYSWRRGRRRQKRTMMRTWMEFHLSLGIVSGIAALLHSGPQFGAPLHGAFLIFWLLLIGTGILGKFLYITIPKRLAMLEEESLLLDDVVSRRAAVVDQLNELVEGADAEIATLADRLIPRQIKSPKHYAKKRMLWSQVSDEVFESIKQSPGVAGNEDLARRLVQCRVEEKFYDAQYRYQMALRIWLPAHVGLTTLCFPWLIIHVATA